jgi:chromatin segregation and condensation protein Rec8/ScpA/Scc1 (kleisin family)
MNDKKELLEKIGDFIRENNNEVLSKFGSWYNVFNELSLKVPQNRKYNKEEVIIYLKKLFNERGRMLTTDEYIKERHIPSYWTIIKLFESWDNALREAEIPSSPNIIRYSDEDILNSIKEFYYEFKEDTSEYKYKKLKRKPGLTTIYRRFGNWNTALRCAGVPTREERRKL